MQVSHACLHFEVSAPFKSRLWNHKGAQMRFALILITQCKAKQSMTTNDLHTALRQYHVTYFHFNEE